jgi:hypothetical protein
MNVSPKGLTFYGVFFSMQANRVLSIKVSQGENFMAREESFDLITNSLCQWPIVRGFNIYG